MDRAQGAYRRFVVTKVRAKWSSVKTAYRITLEDGTQLIASEDHRFLTTRGWKHVTGAEHGPLCRPHLTLNSKLMGTGRFAERPHGLSRLSARLSLRHDPRRRPPRGPTRTIDVRGVPSARIGSDSP